MSLGCAERRGGWTGAFGRCRISIIPRCWRCGPAFTCLGLFDRAGSVDTDWVGKRVVPKAAISPSSSTASRSSGAARDRLLSGRADRRPSLLLKAEKQGVTRLGQSRPVIPVEQAVDFFTPANPRPTRRTLSRTPCGRFIRHDKKQLDLALRDYDEAIRLDPQRRLIYRGRGSVWQFKNEYDKAIADFDEAIQLDPKTTHAFIGRGTSRATSEEYSKAIADVSEAIWLDPLAIAAYDNRGLAWQSKREFAKAIVDYNLAIRLDPRQVNAYCHRGRRLGGPEEIRQGHRRFQRGDPIDRDIADAYSGRAWILATCPMPRYRDGKKAVAVGDESL